MTKEGGGKMKKQMARPLETNFFCYFRFLQIPVHIYLSLVNIPGWSKGGKMGGRKKGGFVLGFLG
jgi:hypothetical protein